MTKTMTQKLEWLELWLKKCHLESFKSDSEPELYNICQQLPYLLKKLHNKLSKKMKWLYLISMSLSTKLRWKSLHNVIFTITTDPCVEVQSERVCCMLLVLNYKCACAQPVFLSHSPVLPLTLSAFGCHSHRWDGSMGDASRFPVKHPHFLPS